eukprot:Nitzschia sp. Nitz4//scaffold284_size24204//18547//19413//NITZ4_008420-RA/size24204-processed-gene-0.12-mRNA-1//-1//CDS//3329545700//153//frame0
MGRDLDDTNMHSSNHSRTRSRSGSRRRRRSEHRRKSVAFAPKVQVRPVKSLIDMEDEEIDGVWYSATELARMRRREEKLIESLSYMEEEDREVLAATYGLSGDILDRKQARVWRVRGCRLAVLSEQECLWEESTACKLGQSTDHHDGTEALRNFSLAVSSHCVQEAQDRALDIFREVVYQMRLDRSRSGVTGGPLEAPNSPARVSAECFLRDQASGILSSPSLCRPQKQIRRKLKLGLPSSPFPQSPVKSPQKSPVKEVILRRGNLRWSDTGTVATAMDPGMMLPFRN